MLSVFETVSFVDECAIPGHTDTASIMRVAITMQLHL